MAGGSLLALLDDITTILDDVSVMTKVAAKKTAGVLGDDLALNAQQVSGVNADRELPVVWAVAKGSLLNKVILVPAALLISTFLPWAVIPLLMIGGAYLCFEGVEKVVHTFFHKKHETTNEPAVVIPESTEKEKIKGAIRTDFILSAEIIVIALGTVAGASFGIQVTVLSGIALVMTIGVYGLVAGIVKLDDLGLWLLKPEFNKVFRKMGSAILKLAPWLMKGLSVAGTIAMFLVGGQIIVHGIPFIHHLLTDTANHIPLFSSLIEMTGNALFGILVGFVVLGGVMTISKLRKNRI
ncbi:MAG: DUF808 domain-containing protein [Bacteroidetes bacterium]|nr:DUF808 domain-containing protein [Bacteroidota bacterium]